MPASEYRALEAPVRELHRLLGKKAMESELLREESSIRRLLIFGSSVVGQATVRGAPAGSRLERMLARKPRMLVAVALANQLARIARAVMTTNEDCQATAAVAA